jgi:hypothetical protein
MKLLANSLCVAGVIYIRSECRSVHCEEVGIKQEACGLVYAYVSTLDLPERTSGVKASVLEP